VRQAEIKTPSEAFVTGNGNVPYGAELEYQSRGLDSSTRYLTLLSCTVVDCDCDCDCDCVLCTVYCVLCTVYASSRKTRITAEVAERRRFLQAKIELCAICCEGWRMLAKAEQIPSKSGEEGDPSHFG
jgi:hypothetical protein